MNIVFCVIVIVLVYRVVRYSLDMMNKNYENQEILFDDDQQEQIKDNQDQIEENQEQIQNNTEAINELKSELKSKIPVTVYILIGILIGILDL